MPIDDQHIPERDEYPGDEGWLSAVVIVVCLAVIVGCCVAAHYHWGL